MALRWIRELMSSGSPEHLERRAAVYGYALAGLVLLKVARAIEQTLRVDALDHWLALPFTLGLDLLVAVAFGVVGVALSRIPPRRWFLAAAWLALMPLALLMPADVMSHRLTGAPLTYQRLRGDEGATLKDLGLLGADDFALGIGGIVLCVAGIWLALRFLGRSRLARWLARPAVLASTAVIGLSLHGAGAALQVDDGELAEQAVVAMVASFVEPKALAGIALTEAQWRELNRAKKIKVAPSVPPLPDDRPRNAIIFLAEGIDYGHTGFGPRFNGKPRPGDKRLPDPTPNLRRRHADHGLLFDRYYANWHASIQAIFSVNCSTFPPLQGDIVRIKPRIDCGQLSEVARARGMRAGLFHGGLFSFYDKLALLGRRGFSIELDAAELAAKSKRQKHEWGIDDRAVVDATLSWIDSLPKDKPFFALIIPITAHYPYWTPRDFKKPFKGSSREMKFLNGVAFQDEVLEQLARGLEKRGLYDETVLAWLGDHGHYVGEPKRVTPGLRGFYEPNLHTPLVLLSPKLFKAQQQRVSQRLGSHIDLLPTMLDAVQLAADPRHDGQSLLSPRFEPRRVFFGSDNGKYVGFIDGYDKVIVDLRGKRAELYDLAKDPDELKNLAGERRAEVAELRKEAVKFARAVQARIAKAPSLSEKLSPEQVYDLFSEHAQVSITAADRSVTSCGGGEDAACPSTGRVMSRYAGTVQREQRRCLMVTVPGEGQLALEVKDRDTLALLSSTMAVLPNDAEPAARFTAFATVDGKPNKLVTLSRSAPLVRVEHPRPRRSFRITLEQKVSRKAPEADASVEPQAPEPREVCVQLSPLFIK